jgi:hypothetical protein
VKRGFAGAYVAPLIPAPDAVHPHAALALSWVARARAGIVPRCKACARFPALKPFDFAMVNGKLLIVNPSDKKIVEVISG